MRRSIRKFFSDDGNLLPWWLISLLAFLLGLAGPWLVLNWRTWLLPMVMLSGCATHSLQFSKEPDQALACVVVQWTHEAEIQNHCAPGASACGTVGTGTNVNMIWTPKPRAFDDFQRVYLLGHELLHSLGARH